MVFKGEIPGIWVDNYQLFYREDIYIMYSDMFIPIHKTADHTMALRVGRQPLTAEAQVRSQDSPRAIRGGRSGTGTRFPVSTSDIACQYDSTSAPSSMSFTYHRRYIILETECR
jgi:hypothetical protein